MNCEEAQELITALVDDELSGSERASIEGHLRECARCQFAHRQERALKTAVRMAGSAASSPAELREKILSGLGRSPGKGETLKAPERPRWLSQLAFRPAFAFALLLLLLLPAIYLMQPKESALFSFALESHNKIVERSMAYVAEKNGERLKAKLVRSVGGEFAPMGYDLSTMGLRPVGGTLQELGGRKILAVLYEGTAPALTCYTFLGSDSDIPAEALLFVDPETNIHFYTLARGGVNGVMHREGKLICILVSKLPMEELLALARSKARPSQTS